MQQECIVASWANEQRELWSAEAVDALLDDLSRCSGNGLPELVELDGGSAGILSIGLGEELSVLTYCGADGTPPFRISVGKLVDADSLSFRFQGSHSEFPGWSAVPTAVAREAVRSFCATRVLPSFVQWEDG
jgi:hypothetical protein